MRKKRLIFTLIYDNGNFMLSRNFRLQKVGDFQWINTYYNFKKISFSIDELVILNVTRGDKNQEKFLETLREIINCVFVPVSIGGGIYSMETAKQLFMWGADKIVLNSCLPENPSLVTSLVKQFGSQSLIGSVDYKNEEGVLRVYTHNGTVALDVDFETYLAYLQKAGVGELYLNSIDKDGTGQGYALDVLVPYLANVDIPVILAGGAGNVTHLSESIVHEKIDAVATANLFNFIGDALPNARATMIEKGISLANFSPASL